MWHAVDTSGRIKKGRIYSHTIDNKPIVYFRDSHGAVHAFDAYCPHLGAHLGVGGTIQNDCLVCPFHGWKFRADGKCVHIPYCEKPPERAQLTRLDVQEIEHTIFVAWRA